MKKNAQTNFLDTLTKIAFTTDVVVFSIGTEKEINYRKLGNKKMQVLLIKRGIEPYLDSWALPGGFVQGDESIEKTAKRELFEETRLKSNYLEQLYTFGDSERDPRTRVVSCAYMALVNNTDVEIQGGDDAKDASWFDVTWKLISEDKSSSDDSCSIVRKYDLCMKNEENELSSVVEHKHIQDKEGAIDTFDIISSSGIAFDHAKIIAVAIKRLQGKLEYTGIAFNLMPTLFTLTELQQVYEVILDKPLLKAAFRRKIAPLVCETNEYAEMAGHRPSKLYKRNWDNLTS